MREIKFRAVFTNEGGEKVVSTNSFSIEELASCEEHEWEFSDGSNLPANDVEDGDLEYIEYTGLKDKNGVDIHEGDILSFKENYITGSAGISPGFIYDNFKCPVVWDEKNALWSFDCDSHERYSEFYEEEDRVAMVAFRNHTRSMMFDGESAEVIGNIYQHKDLLA